MVDIETLLERAQELKGRENGIRWELAEIAYHIVGSPLGRAGATRQLADVCGLSAVDAVEHWAKAYRLYRVIRYMSGLSETYKKEFSVSHFYKMWELGHKYKLSIDEILNHFFMLLTHKYHGDRWSVAELEMLVLSEQRDVSAVDWKKWYWPRLSGIAEKLVTFDGELDEYPEVKGAVKTIVFWKEKIK